jgi:GT2 family glycosyltransferase
MIDPMRVFVCVLSHDGQAKELPRFVEALISATVQELLKLPPVKMIWLEQGASFNGIASQSDVVIWHSTNNVGCAGGRQRLIDYLIVVERLRHGDLVIFLDDDVQFVSPMWLEDFVNASLHADVVGQEGMTVTPDYATLPITQGQAPDYVSGGWSAWHGYVLLGGVQFDLNYHTYWEDVDMCYQARQKHFTLGIVNTHALSHASHMTAIKQERYDRGRDYFIKKWGGAN